MVNLLMIVFFNINSGKLNKVPNCYSRLQIQYSKFGIKDFDFSYYNKTKECCGLENHTDNSYINSLLQLYRFQSVYIIKLLVHYQKNGYLMISPLLSLPTTLKVHLF